MFTVWAPLVAPSQRFQWEEYSTTNAQAWLDESDRLRQVHPSHRDPLHGTIQDHEHDRRRLQERQQRDYPMRIDAAVGRVQVGPSSGEVQQARQVAEDDSPNAWIPPQIWHWEGSPNGTRVVSETTSPGHEYYAPLWQVSPPGPSDINVDMFSDPRVSKLFQAMVAAGKRSVLSDDFPIKDLFDFLFDPEEKSDKAKPHAFLMEPVFDRFDEDPKLVGVRS